MRNIKISAPELIYTDSELSYTVDGSCCTLRRSDGKVDSWTTDLGEKPYYRHFRGTVDNPFEEELAPFTWDYNGYRETWPSGIWVQGFYECEDGMLLGFSHREDLNRDDPDYPQSYHIGFSVSRDGGESWKYLGDALGSVCNYISKRLCGGKYPNVGGVPFIPGKDGYFYFFFNEYDEKYERYVSAARLPMTEAIECARRDESPAHLVRKYSGNGVWDTHPKFGVAAKILPEALEDVTFHEECGYKYDCHSDAAYCKALDKYVLIVQTARQLVLFFSDDCCNWDEHIVAATAEPDKGLLYYSTIIGLDGESSDDFSVVGRDFYVYYTHKTEFLRLPENYGNYEVDNYYRVRVTVGEGKNA